MEYINARMQSMARDDIAKLPIYEIAGKRVWPATDIGRLFHIQSLRTYTSKFTDEERAQLYIPTKLGHRKATVIYEKGVHRLLRDVVKNPDNYRFYFQYFNYIPAVNPPDQPAPPSKISTSIEAFTTVFPDAVIDFIHPAYGKLDMWIPSHNVGIHREHVNAPNVIVYNIHKNYTKRIFSIIHAILVINLKS